MYFSPFGLYVTGSPTASPSGISTIPTFPSACITTFTSSTTTAAGNLLILLLLSSDIGFPLYVKFEMLFLKLLFKESQFTFPSVQ